MILCSLSIQYIHIEYICVCVMCVHVFFEKQYSSVSLCSSWLAYDVADGSCLLSTGREWQKRVRPITKLTRKPSRIELGGWEWRESHGVLFSLQSEECLIFDIVMACSFPEHCVWGHLLQMCFSKVHSARPERARPKPKQLRELPLSST